MCAVSGMSRLPRASDSDVGRRVWRGGLPGLLAGGAWTGHLSARAMRLLRGCNLDRRPCIRELGGLGLAKRTDAACLGELPGWAGARREGTSDGTIRCPRLASSSNW